MITIYYILIKQALYVDALDVNGLDESLHVGSRIPFVIFVVPSQKSNGVNKQKFIQ